MPPQLKPSFRRSIILRAYGLFWRAVGLEILNLDPRWTLSFGSSHLIELSAGPYYKFMFDIPLHFHENGFLTAAQSHVQPPHLSPTTYLSGLSR